MGIRVTELERSLRFYTKLLGLKEERRGNMREIGGGTWVLLRDPKTGARLELNYYPRGSKFATPFIPGEGLDHIGFLLGHVPRSRLETEYRRLLRGGARPTEVTPERTEGWVFHVLDPDGNWVEVFRHASSSEQAVAHERGGSTARKPSRRRRPT